MRLSQPSIALLPAEIIAVYLQAIIKVFSRWAIGLTENWTHEKLPRVKESVGIILDNLRPFASHADIEVQERVSWSHTTFVVISFSSLCQAANTIQLLTLVKGDLDLFRPEVLPIHSPAIQEFPNEFEDLLSFPISTPAFPKGLLLFKRLVSAYSLRPVASNAQKQVAVPDGLNLDKWIVAPPRRTFHDEPDGEEKKKRKKKGKGKARVENGVSGQGRGALLEESPSYPVENEAELAAVRKIWALKDVGLTISDRDEPSV
jgi:AP-3 complex subunit delta